MPTALSISPSPSAKVGVPASGTVHDVRATPIDRVCAFTRCPSSWSATRLAPCSAAAPTIFSTTNVPATPRRPVDQVDASTATSSSITTFAVCLPTANVFALLSEHDEIRMRRHEPIQTFGKDIVGSVYQLL